MLLLRRKVGESVVIADDLEVFVKKITQGRVQLGFKVPKSIPVNRREVLDKIQSSEEEKLVK